MGPCLVLYDWIDVTERRTITHDGQSNRDFFILVDDTLLLVGEITEINRIVLKPFFRLIW